MSSENEAVCNGVAVKRDLSCHDKQILENIFNPNLPFVDVVEENQQSNAEDDVETESVLEAKRLELEGVKAAEEGDVMLALDFFNQSVAQEPNRASGYNNRAQVYRLLNDNKGALEDLNKAIELSGARGKAACQAFTQRGLLNKLDGNNDAALEDFKKAANMGNAFAKQMVISMNPYAALCNQMMSEMIQKVKNGEQ